MKGSFTTLQQPCVYSRFTAGSLRPPDALWTGSIRSMRRRAPGLEQSRRAGSAWSVWTWFLLSIRSGQLGMKNDITIILKATEINIVKSNIITGGWIINRLPVPIISTKFFFLNIMIKNCIL